MSYFIEGNSEIKKICEDYINIKSIDDLYKALKALWNKDTCTPRMQANYSKDNPSLGQCSITAFLVQDIFGGEVYGVDLKDGNYHCYNVIKDTIIDLTSEQFKEALVYDKKNPQSRDIHFQSDEKYMRYLNLKKLLHSYKSEVQ